MALDFKNSWLGSNLKRGALESAGWHYERVQTTLGSNLVSGGFLNEKGVRAAYAANKVAGQKTFSAGARALGKAAIPGLGLVFSVSSIYSGFKEGGITGGLGAAAEAVAFNTAISMLGGAAGTFFGGVVAPLVAVGLGTHALGEAAQAKKKRLVGLEMAAVTPNLINSQGAFTARQRSLQALNDSRINARMAIGNEAALMHTRYR